MKLKVMSGQGTKPPAIGIWWNGDHYKQHAEEVLFHIRKQDFTEPPQWNFNQAYCDYASDLYNWKKNGLTYEKWYDKFWGEEFYGQTTWWGVTYDLEPEVNEFGVISP